MYRTRCIIEYNTSIELSDQMYKINNTNSSLKDSILDDQWIVSEQIKKFMMKHEENSEMTMLQAKQENILNQLEGLTGQMLKLKNVLQPSDTFNTEEMITDANSQAPDNIKKKTDIVINVNPGYNPYSLLALKKLWARSLNLVIKCYLHSTVEQLSEHTKKFVAELEKEEINTTIPIIFVRLIWKNVDEKMELITSSASCPVYGEINILRYLTRVGPKYFNYELFDNPCEIDSVLDICYLLSIARTKIDRKSLLQSLNNKLEKSQWLCCRNTISIADIAACSVIQQVTCTSDLNVNLTKWMKHCMIY